MEPNYWHGRWARNELGFHESQANAMLVKYFHRLGLPEKARVFVPLCGKTRDIAWLLARGHRVAGAELSELAIRQLFEDLGVVPQIAQTGGMRHFAAQNLDVFAGDIFDLTADMLGQVDAVHDRAALFALPPAMRAAYVGLMALITGRAPQMLNCFEFDQSLMNGPPFSVDGAEVTRLFSADYDISLLERFTVAGGVRGNPAQDAVWLLTPRAR